MSVAGVEDTEFLKDQVHRLSTSLSQYQRRYPSMDGPLDSQVPGVKGPWLTNKRYLSPLLTEYDQTVDELNQQVAMYKTEVESMCARVETVTQENSRLHVELRKSLEARIDAVTQQQPTHQKPPKPGGRSAGEVGRSEALQQQLAAISKDRDNYRDLLQKMSQELELSQRNDQDKSKQLLECKAGLVQTQQASIAAEKNMGELELTCTKLDQERSKCLRTVKAQEVELSTLQDNLNQVKTELKTAVTKNDGLKKSLDEITFQLKKRESEQARAMDTENSLDDRLHIMQITNTDLEGKLLATQRENVILNEEKTDLTEALSSVQARVSALEQREYEAVCHVKESMQIAESALLEKEQAVIREQQLSKEVERQKLVMATILKEAGERTRREVDLVREECNKSIDKMGMEIHHLEQDCGDYQVQLERSRREKKVVERELEKSLAQKPLEVVQTGENIHELQKRACLAERARDDAQVKLESIRAANKRLESNLSDAKQDHAQLSEELRRFQRQVQEETQSLRQQKIKAMASADNLMQKLRVSQQGKEAAELRLLQELAAMERKQEVKEKEIKYRLESSEEAHQRSIQELRGLLTAQHKVGTRWREESKALATKFEKTISELKSELVRHRSRSEELAKQLSHMKRIKEELEQQLKIATRSNTNLQERLRAAEVQGEEAMEEVSELVSREKQLLQERRELNRQLDKVKLHMSRSTGTVLSGSQHMHSTKLPSMQHMAGTRPLHTPQDSSYLLPPSHHQDKSVEWNQTLSQLKHSIQQVREDLGLAGVAAGHLSGGQGQAEDDTLSEHSALSRRDLSYVVS